MLFVLLSLAVGACPPKTFCNTTGAVASDHLFTVEAVSQSDVWAFGSGGPLHWDGTRWALVPILSRTPLRHGLALGPDDIWATGGTDAFHWDGTAWTQVDKGRDDGWAGPVVRLASGEVWLLADPIVRVAGGKLAAIDPAVSKQFSSVRGFSTAAITCGQDLWVGREAGQPILQRFDGKQVKRIELPGSGQIYGLVCIDTEVWVTLETQLYRCSSACQPVSAPPGARLLRGKLGPWAVADDGLYRWEGERFEKKSALTGRFFGGAARTDTDVWFVGHAGATGHFDGKTTSLAVNVDVGRVSELSATRAGDVWAVSDTGLFSFRDAGWKRIKSFPGRLGWGGRVWADSQKFVWVIADEHAWRWGGAGWADLTPAGQQVVDVWGRGENDVYLSTGDALLHSTGGRFVSIATAPSGWSFGHLEGDATHVAAIVRGPRPEGTDGPSTKKPDRVLVLEKSGQTTFELPYRERLIGFVNGELWAGGGSPGGISRRSGDRWVPVSKDKVFVPTAGGATLASGSDEGADWDGQSLTRFKLPVAAVEHGVGVGTSVWLAGDHVILRRD